MINRHKLLVAMDQYVEQFPKRWKDERFKWEAVKNFQENWDIEAPDFAQMFYQVTDKLYGLLNSMNNFPRKMLYEYALEEPETVRMMFSHLFDETKDVGERILEFQASANKLCERLTPGKQHYQRPMAISVYLWLKYPDTYSIFKYTVCKDVTRYLESEFLPKKGQIERNIKGNMELIQEITEVIDCNQTLLSMFENALDEKCYADRQHKTLAFDICFYISEQIKKIESGEMFSLVFLEQKKKESISYKKEDFLREVYLSEENYDTLCALLSYKKNLILQGAPGVGKTFIAKRLAYSLMGEKDEDRIALIQFHQSYSYEDFIMGYKPCEDGFSLKYGIFYEFCKKAQAHPNQPYFFLIDEINRGNMSKIFGELLMLIEKDYRGESLCLAYDGQKFSVPPNLYLIGMMNTADRSLAMIDYALRRRFSFFTVEPAYTSEGFQTYMKNFENESFVLLIEKIQELNKEICKDSSLGSGFCIGHSYFCGQRKVTEDWLQSVVEYDLLPMLEEYCFDEPKKLKRWKDMLRGIFND